jgi:hypothetical protein
MEARKCSECGAVFRDGPASGKERCPLCGAKLRKRERVVFDADDYQANIRALRKELQRLRRGA